MNKRIYLSPPHMGGDELRFVHEAFSSNWIAPLGPNVDAFEREAAAVSGRRGGAALTSGTAAIHLALKACGVQRGDAVLCSSLTFAGTSNPILYEGAVPVFVDAEPTTWNMCPDLLQKAIDDLKSRGIRCKAAVVVDLYGQSADYERILPILDREGIPLIEDAAEALGSSYRGRPCGAFGRMGILSFNGNKIITTSGGGMLVADEEELLQKTRFLATQARDPAPHYEHSEIGFNYRMSNIVAGIGRGQLLVLDSRVARKREIFEIYRQAMADIPEIIMTPLSPKGVSNCWLTTITIRPDAAFTPFDLMKALEADTIESRPVWKPMHLQPVFRTQSTETATLAVPTVTPPHPAYVCGGAVSEDIFRRGLCLPSGTAMTEADMDRICRIIRCVAGRSGASCKASGEDQ